MKRWKISTFYPTGDPAWFTEVMAADAAKALFSATKDEGSDKGIAKFVVEEIRT